MLIKEKPERNLSRCSGLPNVYQSMCSGLLNVPTMMMIMKKKKKKKKKKKPKTEKKKKMMMMMTMKMTMKGDCRRYRLHLILLTLIPVSSDSSGAR